MSEWDGPYEENAFDFEDHLRAGIRDCIDSVRRARGVSPAEVRALRRMLDRLRSAVARDPELDLSEFRSSVERARALISHLEALTRADIERVAERAFSIRPEDAPDVLTLLILARPNGSEYWDLARAVHAHLDGAVADNPTTEIVRARWLLRAVVPTHAFRSREYYPSFGRGASRATHVESVTPAGLPSLGKRG